MNAHATTIATVILLTTFAPVAGGDWPQWRGPTRDGVSPESGLPLTWTNEKNVAWKLPMPARSGSTPIVWGERIFLSVAQGEKDGDLSLWSVDRRSGEVVWRRTLAAGGNASVHKHNMSSPSPVTDGRHVFAMTGTGVLKAFGFDGAQVWSRDLQHDYGPFGLQWGYASSPLLYEDSLYVQVLHGMKTDAPSYVLRIDKKTGATRWRVERPTEAVRESPDAYTTPALLRHRGSVQIVISGGDAVTGHDAKTGEELWRATVLNPGHSTSQRIVASPLVAAGLVFAFGKRGPVVALRPDGRGDVTESHVVWTLQNGTDVPTPVSDGKHLYVVNDKGIAWCIEARSGRVVWGPERLETATYSASPVLAGGRIYATSEDGTTTVIGAGPMFEVLATNELGEYTLSSPAVSDGQIFLRTQEHLYAIGKRRSR